MSVAMEGRAARRRQLANLYQAGSEDSLLRRRRPRKASSKPAKSRVCREREMVRREKDRALYESVVETVQFGQRRAWHYGYRNQAGLSGSGPLAAASRYGAAGTLRMILRDTSAARGGGSVVVRTEDDAAAERFQVDEWSPMLRCSTAPSLATMTTPKTWPESAMYPHGSRPKRMQPSPWYDGETTANDFRAATAGPGMRRAAASHGFIMSILERDARLERTGAEAAVPRPVADGSQPPGSAARPSSTTGGGEMVARWPGTGTGTAVGAHVRTPKKLDQQMGFLTVGTVFMAPKDPVRLGLDEALAARLVQQTELDGLKWDLLKQVLKAISGSQHGIPAQAVKEVAATFAAVVGTSKLATEAQFVDHITGKHVGFPASELITLFGFFRSPRPAGAEASDRATRASRGSTARKGGRGSAGTTGSQGADWTLAVACLTLLARPKESVMASVLGVFDVFARARGDRARHELRLERARLEKERQARLEEERERWRRRRRREQERGIAPSAESFPGSVVRILDTAPPVNGKNRGAGQNGGPSCSPILDRASFAETARIFTLVCSNDQERHAMTTTYRHRFQLELRAVIQEERSRLRTRSSNHQRRSESCGGCGDGDGDGNGSPTRKSTTPKGADLNPMSPDRGSCSPSEGNSAFQHRRAREAQPRSPAGGWSAAAVDTANHPDAGPKSGEGKDQAEAEGRAQPGDGGRGVTIEEFSEALRRCPEMLEVFGCQLSARLRHRHRPIWMAPFMRKGA